MTNLLRQNTDSAEVTSVKSRCTAHRMFAQSAALAICALGTTGAFAAQNLIVNGDFSGGTSGYQTQYTGTDTTGYQYIATNPQNVYGGFPSLDGNANGHGNQLVLDGAANGGYFFQETVGIVAGTSYTLSFDAANLNNCCDAPNLVASINGTPLFTTGFLSYDDTYHTFSTTFDAGLATSATITLADLTNTHNYNDFAIDNVSFVGAAPTAAIPEPASWAMMIAGFGMVGVGMRSASRRTVLRHS